ncbi:hypothetical protein ES702_04412 [subsurface metagenome]
MDKLNIQSILINALIVMAVMMLVFRVDFLTKLITGGK